MYPFFRTTKILLKARTSRNKMSFQDTGIIKTRVWLSDIDIYPELNNGRHLTLMDLGRYDFGYKVGLIKVLKNNNWGLMIAGNFTRYRRRLKLFHKFAIHTELVGYDEKWYYFYQQTKRNDVIHSSALIRGAVISEEGLIPTQKVANLLGIEFKPNVPEWVEDWIALNKKSPAL